MNASIMDTAIKYRQALQWHGGRKFPDKIHNAMLMPVNIHASQCQAAALGVDDKTVGVVRQELVSTAEIPQCDRFPWGTHGTLRGKKRELSTSNGKNGSLARYCFYSYLLPPSVACYDTALAF
ncbi:hypothetical protein ACJU26_04770 [Acidithiobacillus sp. M4-SHS-6]|uniref:hypothetical protein n=1 Tax=Acidithiobacillus sp. M4-SHS-6 TaxID=3383024 RepID=UPI0039BE0320